MPDFNFVKSSARLGNNLGAQPSSHPHAAHHIIPGTLVQAGTDLQDRIREGYTAANKDFDIDDRSNGIWLPTWTSPKQPNTDADAVAVSTRERSKTWTI